MKRATWQHGYTIVEVMIFLVVTGALLASAIAAFNGQQERTQFTQSIRELDSKIRDTANEVTSGFYSKTTGFTCISNPAPGTPPVINTVVVGPGNPQGTSTGCEFTGKVLQFVPHTCNAASHNNCYNVFTVIGKRQTTAGGSLHDVGTLQEAVPIAVVPTTSAPSRPDFTDYQVISGSLYISGLFVRDTSGNQTPIGAFGFISSLANYASSNLVASAQTTDIVSVPGSLLNQDTNTIATNIQNLQDSNRNPGSIVICLQNGASAGARKAVVIVGNNNRKLATDVQIDTLTGVNCP